VCNCVGLAESDKDAKLVQSCQSAPTRLVACATDLCAKRDVCLQTSECGVLVPTVTETVWTVSQSDTAAEAASYAADDAECEDTVPTDEDTAAKAASYADDDAECEVTASTSYTADDAECEDTVPTDEDTAVTVASYADDDAECEVTASTSYTADDAVCVCEDTVPTDEDTAAAAAASYAADEAECEDAPTTSAEEQAPATFWCDVICDLETLPPTEDTTATASYRADEAQREDASMQSADEAVCEDALTTEREDAPTIRAEEKALAPGHCEGICDLKLLPPIEDATAAEVEVKPRSVDRKSTQLDDSSEVASIQSYVHSQHSSRILAKDHVDRSETLLATLNRSAKTAPFGDVLSAPTAPASVSSTDSVSKV